MKPVGKNIFRNKPAVAALAAAIGFGAAVPLCKMLPTGTIAQAFLIAGLLYIGAGLAVTIYGIFGTKRQTQANRPRLKKQDMPWLIGAVLCGGLAAPVLLLLGIAAAPAMNSSLLLNFEAILTAMLAFCIFRESIGRRIWVAVVVISAGGGLLSIPQGSGSMPPASVAAILGACLLWGLDNNLTRKISLNSPTAIIRIKGFFAGGTNVAIALIIGAQLPSAQIIGASLGIGAICYGMSLMLFIIALRHLGAARTSAYFAIAPFFGAALSIILFAEPFGIAQTGAAALMIAGAWLLYNEKHAHKHIHAMIEHDHTHRHGDAHHTHEHDLDPSLPHRHPHKHEALTHSHEHAPDEHHRHKHKM